MFRLFGHYMSISSFRLFIVECAALFCILFMLCHRYYMSPGDSIDIGLIFRVLCAMLFIGSLMFSIGLYDRVKFRNMKWLFP